MEGDRNVYSGISDLWRESLLQNEPHIALILWPGQMRAGCACKLMCSGGVDWLIRQHLQRALNQPP